MKVELLKNLKGDSLWKKGVYDDSISPISKDIMQEVAQGSRNVKVFPEPKAIEPITQVETTIPEVEITDLTPGMSENFSVPEEVEEGIEESGTVEEEEVFAEEVPEEESPEAATEKNVVVETDNASFLTKETPTKHLPELEGLIHAKGTIAAVANLLNVTYATVSRWRKGSTPKPKMLKKIKKEHNKLRPGNDQDRTDDIASAGVEGTFIKP